MSENMNGEILYIYEAKMINPNGDPLRENRPRMIEDFGWNIVSDVRLKRTIRDYLNSVEGKDIFVMAEKREDGTIKTREERLEEAKKQLKLSESSKLEVSKKLAEHFIDIKLFGATIAAKSDKKGENAISILGPVQFRFGRSLNKVVPKIIGGTTVFPSGKNKSGKNKSQGTFTETWIVPYSLIAFYGTVNDRAANYTGLTWSDIDLMLKAMWEGTIHLDTRSKVGQVPRLLVMIQYIDNYRIQDLDETIKMISNKSEGSIGSISDFFVDTSKFLEKVSNAKKHISRIKIKTNELPTVYKDKSVDIIEELRKILGDSKVEVMNW